MKNCAYSTANAAKITSMHKVRGKKPSASFVAFFNVSEVGFS